ncbi:MAG: ABC transporter ATP-binding protein [Clostridia bacterium]|nr:ABC transporter ATP-binding protein [Clostridia bacterium]
MKHLLFFFKKYKWQSILAPLFKMLEATFDLLVPLVVADIINVGITSDDTSYILIRFGILIAMAVLGLACSFTAQFFSANAATGTSAGLRKKLLAKIQSLSFSDLDRVGTSTLITRMTSDVNQVQNGINMFLRLFLRSPFIVFGAMIMAFSIDTQVASVFAIVIPVLFVIVFGIMRLTNPLYKRLQKQVDKTTVTTRENLSGVRVVRAFGKEREETERFAAESQTLTNTQVKVGNISALTNPLTYVVINLGIVGILWLGAKRVDGGILLSGDVIALVNYLSQVLIELVKLANLIVLLGKSVVSMNRIGQVLDVAPSMSYGEQTTLSDTDEAVAFNNVCLRYTKNADNALENISFTIKRGQTVGVIGGTGSGKSSLVGLISRFYDATEGQVRVLGNPVQAWSKEFLTKHVAVVLQRAQLFSGTIRSNLAIANPTATDEEMWNALRLAQAEEFVKALPNGLDAPVEQGGRNLSGGQKQRLTIARSLLVNPEILILDDSASALDYATDAALRKALRELPKEKTVIIVSQRTSTIRHADLILTLEDGNLVGAGTHESLLETCETYREIHESMTAKEDK